MHVYGDVEQTEHASAVANEIRRRLERHKALLPGLERHKTLVAAFIRAAELVQGVADAELAKAGMDDVSLQQDAGTRMLWCLSKAIITSWTGSFASDVPLQCERDLAALSGAGAIRTRQAEGYAFYALYPEAYVAAAQKSRLGSDTTVIGIRSIGIGLAALVAAAIGAPAAFSIRPQGHHFDRRMIVSEKLASRLLASNGPYAIVDEGPGLSGSSFNCVADWLVAAGVDEDRIHFFPSHNGHLGIEAQPAHQHRWSRAQKHMSSFDEIVFDNKNRRHRLDGWIEDAVGPLIEPLKDISGGAWRVGGDVPPSDSAMEKRKFLATTAEGKWLAKFVGVGCSGESRLKLARTIAHAGFAPRPIGLCHGFLVMPWTEPAPAAETRPPRERLLDYLSFRARLPANRAGGPLSQLFEMACYNLGLCLGPEVAAAVKEALGDPKRFEPVPCCTDNRLHLWEWVYGKDGWMKLDATDHHAAHDLVGCQDIAWDVAGASVEFGLDPDQQAALAHDVQRRINRPVSQDFVSAMELCYLGFQVGLWTMALGRNGADEQPRIKAQLSIYEGRVLRSLATSKSPIDVTWVDRRGSPLV